MPTNDLIERLRRTEAALLRTLDAMDRLAESVDAPPEQLLNPSGEYVVAPVLVALANVQIALLSRAEAGPCGAESWPGNPRAYRCALPNGHDGKHVADDNLTRWENNDA